jgi:O-antigen biosynthesis protein
MRLFTLMSLMAREHEVDFFDWCPQPEPAHDPARAGLQRLGIALRDGPVEACLAARRYDIVFAEYFGMAAAVVHQVRTWQPQARLVVDTGDVHFNRLRSKAKLTGKAEDAQHAQRIHEEEMNTYRAVDVVATISEDDDRILAQEGLQTTRMMLSNVHEMYPLEPRQRGDRLELLFIGSYGHEPNVDAAVYFCTEVFPLVRSRVPSVRVRLIGSNLQPQVQALAGNGVEVLGFVPSTTPYLQGSHISIAPLRFGGGMKCKVGEAMAHGLPVVTTSFGAEGFGFVDGRDFIVADTAEDFAQAIVRLWSDPALYEALRRNAWQRIDESWSMAAMQRRLPRFLERVMQVEPKRISPLRRLRSRTMNQLRALKRLSTSSAHPGP